MKLINSNTIIVGRLSSDEFSVSPFLAVMLTFNFLVEVYRSLHEPLAMAFVALTYSDLMLLFWCLREYEQEEDNTARKERFRIAILALPTSLMTMFTYRVAAIMPLAVDVLLWSMVGICVAGTVYAACFPRHARGGDDIVQQEKQSIAGHEFDAVKIVVQ